MKKTLIALTLLGGLALSTSAQAKGHRHAKGGGGGGNHEERQEKFLEKFDTDGDGQLSQEERDAARGAMGKGGKGHGPRKGHGHLSKEEMLEKFDTDKDGKLSDDERKAAHEAMKAKALEKFDADGDGQLSDDEKKAAHEAMKGQRGKECKKCDKNKDLDADDAEFEELDQGDFAE